MAPGETAECWDNYIDYIAYKFIKPVTFPLRKLHILSQSQLYPLLFVLGLLEIRGRPCEGLPEATPSLRGLGRGSWEQKATKAMKREGA